LGEWFCYRGALSLNDVVEKFQPATLLIRPFPSGLDYQVDNNSGALRATQETVMASAKRGKMQEAQSGAIIAIEGNRVEQFILVIASAAPSVPTI
jgi:hypothetical protein